MMPSLMPQQSPKRSRTPQPSTKASSSSSSLHQPAASPPHRRQQLPHAHAHHPNPRAASPSYSQSSSSGSISNLASSSSSGSHFHAGRQPTILSPFVDVNSDEDGDDELNHPVEFVQAEHDFLPVGNPTYLSFVRNNIIKVYNKDPSGWWDGELEGRRGWFPSNYVNTPSRIDIAPISEPMSRQSSSTSSSSQSSRSWNRRPSEASSIASSSVSNSSGWRPNNPHSSPLFSSQPFAGSSSTPARNGMHRRVISQTPESIMEPIVHAIALLENAVGANRVTHFQPSTACVISSIRSVLSATDCLTKESPLLRTQPGLARERKQVLSELSRLVAQARKASAPMTEESNRAPEMSSMIHMSTKLLDNVRRFLEVAVGCGVELPERRASQGGGVTSDEDDEAAFERLDDIEKTPTPAYQTEAALAAFGRVSPGPNRRLQAAFQQREPAALTLQVQRPSHSRNRPHVERRASEESDQTTDSEAGSSSPQQDRTERVRLPLDDLSPGHGSLQESLDSSSTGPSSWDEPDVPPTPNPLQADANGNIDALASVKISHEHLLSIIAAFIGHIHSHSASSHPSSHAHLLDVTRDCIDNVRELLTVVEAVSFHTEIRATRPIDVSQLEIAGASLYEATAHLVASAEEVAGLPFDSSSSSQDHDDDARARLLHGATGTLRTAADCVQLVTRCVTRDRGLPDHAIKLDPSRRQQFLDHQQQGGDDQGDPHATPRRTKPIGHRDSNTLSALGRKATTLEGLKKRYEEGNLEVMMDGATLDDAFEDETIEGGQDETPRRSLTMPARTSQASMTTIDTTSSKQTFASALTSRTEQIRTSGEPTRAGSPLRISDSTEASLAFSTNSTSTEESLRTSYEGSDLGKSIVKVASTTHSPTLAEFPDDRAYPDKSIPLAHSILDGRNSMGYHRPRSSSIPSRPEAVAAQAATPMVKSSTEIPRMNSGDARLWVVSHDYHPTDIAYSAEGQIVGGTLAVLVEKMTPHDSTVDPNFATTFYLTFRLFTTPTALLDEVLRRYDLRPPPGMVLGPAEQQLWRENKVMPVRLRIYNFLKTWLDLQWQTESDSVVLPQLLAFARDIMAATLPGMAPRLIESIMRRKVAPDSTNGASNLPLPANGRAGMLSRNKSTDRLRSGAGGLMMTREGSSASSNSAPNQQPPPTPVIARGLMNHLRNQSASLGITDFDALELARQLTIMESKLYNVIRSEDLLQSGKRASPALKAMSTFSNQITGFVSEVILNEQDQKKRTALLKYFVKLTTRLVDLQNYSGGVAVLAALNGSSITRLKKTWEALPTKSKNSHHALRNLFDVSRNHAVYRARLRETSAPALPYLGLILTDLTFCNDGNQDTRPSPQAPEKTLINVSKFNGLTRIVGDFQKFQVPFSLAEVPEVQIYLKRVLAERGSGTIENMYRKSLMLEPRSAATGGGQPQPQPVQGAGNPYRVM